MGTDALTLDAGRLPSGPPETPPRNALLGRRASLRGKARAARLARSLYGAPAARMFATLPAKPVRAGGKVQMHDEHDHDHRHGSHRTDVELRVRAVGSLLLEKGYVDPKALDLLNETYETRIGPHNGARVVAKAWADPDSCRQARRTIAGARCSSEGAPTCCMATRNSARSNSSTRSTPSCPNAPSPQRPGRPMPTAFAPSASAFTISVPRRKPLSTSTGILPAASMISGSASMVERPLSSLRPPWLETMIASMPLVVASLASSCDMIPLRRSLILTVSRKRLMISQVM